MAKFAMFFSYTPDTWSQMMQNPSDRLAASRAAIEPIGQIEALYFMFGDWDGFSIIDVPDADTAAAISGSAVPAGTARSRPGSSSRQQTCPPYSTGQPRGWSGSPLQGPSRRRETCRIAST